MENSERSEATGADSTALDRVVANGILTASIITSLAFILWNENFASDYFSDQWVTWSLLITLILGSIAMLSSAVQVHTMNTSFRAVLFFKELKINGQAVEYVDKRAAKTRAIGFTYGTAKASKASLWNLIQIESIGDAMALAFFGPMFFLLPSSADVFRESEGVKFQVATSVRGQRVMLTTDETDRHSKDVGDFLEPINVCYVPSAPTEGAHQTDKSCESG